MSQSQELPDPIKDIRLTNVCRKCNSRMGRLRIHEGSSADKAHCRILEAESGGQLWAVDKNFGQRKRGHCVNSERTTKQTHPAMPRLVLAPLGATVHFHSGTTFRRPRVLQVAQGATVHFHSGTTFRRPGWVARGTTWSHSPLAPCATGATSPPRFMVQVRGSVRTSFPVDYTFSSVDTSTMD